ncbi:MAG: hypothetical protein ACRY3E_03350 [Candidatus Lariskella arthropodorum]
MFYGRKLSSLKSAAFFNDVSEQVIDDAEFISALNSVVQKQIKEASKIDSWRDTLSIYAENFRIIKKCVNEQHNIIDKYLTLNETKAEHSTDDSLCTLIPNFNISKLSDLGKILPYLDFELQTSALHVFGDWVVRQAIKSGREEEYNYIVGKLNYTDHYAFTSSCLMNTYGDYSWCVTQANEHMFLQAE